jgi:hypothetical protein
VLILKTILELVVTYLDENPSTADGVIIVATPGGTSEQFSTEDDQRQLKEFGSILKGSRIVVLINKL